MTRSDLAVAAFLTVSVVAALWAGGYIVLLIISRAL
jgi:hypothetical protein